MTLRRLVAVALVLAVLFVRVATATTFESKDVTCPVCSKAFTVQVIRSTNTYGGVDSDGCAHANGEQPNSVHVWTCPKCHYSNWAKEFLKSVRPETAAEIKKGLLPAAPIAADAGQLEIPAWVKYDLASRVASMDGRDAADVAMIDLAGSWATRVESRELAWPSVDDPALKPGWEAASERFEALVTDGPERDPVGSDRTPAETRAAVTFLAETKAAQAKGTEVSMAEFFAAWRLRVRGENAVARPVFVGIETRETAPSPLRTAAHLMIDSIDRERPFQERYVKRLDDVVRSIAANAPLVAVRRLQGAEALRRMGHAEEARAAYLVLVAEETPAWVFEAAVRVLGDAAPADRVAAIRRRHIADAAIRVLDPHHAESAAYELLESDDPAAIAALVAALGSKEREVRERGALAFQHIYEPGVAALAALAALTLEDGHDWESCGTYAAKALANYGAPSLLESWKKTLVSDAPRLVREIAATALGVAGEAETAGFVLSNRDKAPYEIDEALTTLTNREWKSAQEFEDSPWWKENRDKTRREWVVSGFRDAGLTVPEDLWQDANVPTLIAWLGDSRWWIRANAVRVLRDITGNHFGWEALTSKRDERAEREVGVRDWRRWLEQRGTKK